MHCISFQGFSGIDVPPACTAGVIRYTLRNGVDATDMWDATGMWRLEDVVSHTWTQYPTNDRLETVINLLLLYI